MGHGGDNRRARRAAGRTHRRCWWTAWAPGWPRVVDGLGTWDIPLPAWRDQVDTAVADLVDAWRSVDGLAVAVTNEVGWGVVPEHRSGRIFTELLGRVNTAVAAASDELVLVVAGRPLRI